MQTPHDTTPQSTFSAQHATTTRVATTTRGEPTDNPSRIRSTTVGKTTAPVGTTRSRDDDSNSDVRSTEGRRGGRTTAGDATTGAQTAAASTTAASPAASDVEHSPSTPRSRRCRS
jgi:hypothetical protein